MRAGRPLDPADEPAANAMVRAMRRPVQRWWPIYAPVLLALLLAGVIVDRSWAALIVLVLLLPSTLLNLYLRQSINRYRKHVEGA